MKLCNARVNFGGANQPRLGRKEPNMIIIGCDYHPGFQQIAFVDTDTGEWNERKLGHREEAEQFYRQLKVRGKKVRVGMEASGHARWFERLLTEVQFELWIGDAAENRTKRVRKQKTDRQDAELLLRLLIEDRFPRIWVADGENRDLRQLLWHRHRLVQMRTRIMNQLHVLALNEGVRRKKAAASENRKRDGTVPQSAALSTSNAAAATHSGIAVCQRRSAVRSECQPFTCMARKPSRLGRATSRVTLKSLSPDKRLSMVGSQNAKAYAEPFWTKCNAVRMRTSRCRRACDTA